MITYWRTDHWKKTPVVSKWRKLCKKYSNSLWLCTWNKPVVKKAWVRYIRSYLGHTLVGLYLQKQNYVRPQVSIHFRTELNKHTGMGNGRLSFRAIAFSALCPVAVAATYSINRSLYDKRLVLTSEACESKDWLTGMHWELQPVGFQCGVSKN